MTLNKYCQALAALRSQPAHELKEVGDQWRTPDLLFWGINALFGPLVLDLFADDDNAKCPAWYTAEDNALTQNWSERLDELGGAAFANPPYSRSQYHDKQAITGMTHIMNHTMDMRERGGRYIYLVKSATSETWWPEDADHIMFIRGRIGFDLPVWFVPADEKQKPTSAFFAGAIAVFDKSWRGERFSYINRTELEAKGRAFMTLAQFAASKSQPATATPPVADKPEAELPLTQKDIFDISGVEAWACVRAAFGDKEEYTFSESKFGHTWAADSVDAPEFAQVSPLTIDKAKLLIRESILFGVDEWLLSIQFDDSATRLDMSERIRTVAIEASGEYGMNSTDFIAAMGSLDVSRWSNIRQIRMHIREKAQPVADPHPESRIWPLEVGIVFDQVDGADMLDETQQNKLKANINQLWLERTATSEIITAASELVRNMRGEAS
ncbi:phage N-6-adenine-methyltransferase [Citrobacter freundii]|uniref:phage N-6-adenine-methyltransferase n=1 Tax=Citrobacter freundii TaxID=546 RepID=UPI0028E24820|nr:phage N-6-adenine-methyltransferase [Citrobacter freundii]WNT13323.1 phage N-6-adenine-methyltransferase [Citrobacter freundii]HCL6754424.1 phage N-6-adenine-methyltransferase [Citrobacter freundii]